MPPIPAQPEGTRWLPATWGVCIVLLLASTLNYMDRQTLSVVKKEIQTDFRLQNEHYGNIELGFGLAFAAGALVFGYLADRVNVRWLYPIMIVLWSMAGAATAYSRSYEELLICRILLGFFEAAHWPCALRTTQRLLAPSERSFGNSILQSGASIGAVFTPLVMKVMLTNQVGWWRTPFLVIGSLGIVWLFAWFSISRRVDLTPERREPTQTDSFHWWSDSTFVRKFLLLVGVVVAINTAWQLYRAWLPAFLEEGRGYTKDQMFNFISIWYIGTDVGCILAGMATVWLHGKGQSVGRARRIVFTMCALSCATSIFIPWLPKGPLLLGVLLLIAGGLLGLFPCYYTWSQDLSRTHQGKVTGLLSTLGWLASSPVQKYNGRLADYHQKLVAAGQTPWIGPFDAGLAIAGCLPLIGAILMWIWWEGRVVPAERVVAE